MFCRLVALLLLPMWANLMLGIVACSQASPWTPVCWGTGVKVTLIQQCIQMAVCCRITTRQWPRPLPRERVQQACSNILKALSVLCQSFRPTTLYTPLYHCYCRCRVYSTDGVSTHFDQTLLPARLVRRNGGVAPGRDRGTEEVLCIVLEHDPFSYWLVSLSKIFLGKELTQRGWLSRVNLSSVGSDYLLWT